MFFLLNEFSCAFSGLLIDQQHMDIRNSEGQLQIFSAAGVNPTREL